VWAGLPQEVLGNTGHSVWEQGGFYSAEQAILLPHSPPAANCVCVNMFAISGHCYFCMVGGEIGTALV